MIVVEHPAELRAHLDSVRARGVPAAGGASPGAPGGQGVSPRVAVGFVPTMGAFHDGHRSLMRAARAGCGFVAVSLFVNPLQFGPGEDLDRYPRDRDGDVAVARAEGVDVLFTPAVEDMYPGGPPLTTVHVAGLSEGLCGAVRPGHFDGVATVVAKLFSLVGPCTAYFGRKDAQQLAVVRRLAADLSMPVEVVGCPVVREPDGLAMSSRNRNLSPAEREAAAVIHRGLRCGAELVTGGERDAGRLRRVVANVLTTEPLVRLEYAEVVDAAHLAPVEQLDGEVLVAVAARVGDVRLIDNVTVRVEGDTATVDLGVTVGEAACAAG